MRSHALVQSGVGSPDKPDVTIATAQVPFATPVRDHAQAAGASPLSAEHLWEMHDARQRATKVRRCIMVVKVNGWSIGVFGALTLLFGMFSLTGWVLGGGMIALASVELGAVAGLKRIEPSAARRLGWNQLALAGLLLAYAGWSLYGAMFGPDPLASTIAAVPEAAEMLAPYSSMARMISAAVYVALALVAIFAQGGTALYYFTREKHIRAYRAQTPGWIVQMQQAGAPL